MKGILWMKKLGMLITAVSVSVVGVSYISYRQIFRMSGLNM